MESFDFTVGLWPAGPGPFGVTPSWVQASRQAWDLQAAPLSQRTRSTVTFWSANRVTARRSTPIAVAAFSSVCGSRCRPLGSGRR